MRKYFLAALLMSFSNLTLASYVDGNKLNTLLDAFETGNDGFNAGLYAGYILGVVDSGNSIVFCTPSNVTNGQLAAMVGKFIKANPELWNKPGYVLVTRSLMQAFPCNAK